MQVATSMIAAFLVGAFLLPVPSVGQATRIEAESGVLNGFSVVQNVQFSGGVRVNGDIANPTATYVFGGEDGVYDVWVRFCDEDDGISSYELSGSSAGVFATWGGDQATGSTICNSTSLQERGVATSVALHQGETLTFSCQRDPAEPCRVDYFEFDAVDDLRIEAESGALNGFSVVQNVQFSGGARVNGDIANPTATYVFGGGDGVYDVLVRFCDEDDGISSYELSGSSAGVFATWSGDQTTGSTICNSTSLQERQVATSVALQQGENLTFSCQRDPTEPCRVDYFEFNAVDFLRIEAESGALNGFSVVQNVQFSGGARVNGDIANPTATYVFGGGDGVYDVWVRFCDEDDGISSYELSGSSAGVFATWSGDQATGSTICNSESLQERQVATSVALQQGENLTFSCQRDPAEPCRVDYFDFSIARDPAVAGEWSAPFGTDVRAIHAVLLPTGKVMYWPQQDDPHVWDPASDDIELLTPAGYNIFCSGHSTLADGRQLVAGGDLGGDGLANASVYSPVTDTWTQLPDMNAGRWYPTNTTLANGEVLVVAGWITGPGTEEGGQEGVDNVLPQVWTGSGWRNLTNAEMELPLYPEMFLAPNGKVFMAGPDVTTRYLDTAGTGQWTTVASRVFPHNRSYGSAVMYDDGKVFFAGGGSPPTATAEVIDLNEPSPSWRYVGSMETERRQINATILADGKVLVTGGVSGPRFNNTDTAVFTAELWDSVTEQFTTVARMRHPRWYHSTALLLPDGRVLSAGGDGWPTAEVYSPPYLFQGTRPVIGSAPQTVEYGETFSIDTLDAATITAVHLIRLGSVTHATNMDQRINRLSFSVTPGGLTVTAPSAPEQAPPGPYMLFLLNDDGVPSVATILTVTTDGSG